ncbi:helix-turn-helix domain-containing protein [Candidatus Clostridium radicumherbarum]|uniref:Helix-turn-helix transcriptional regulator n=1 Tax=Candidatus Clostridium radicumherbarum TaxID=3381662 RepID=A0ABW8TSS9_9CLOT
MLDNKEWLRVNDILIIIHSTDDLKFMCNYFLEALKPLILFEKAIFYLLSEENSNIVMSDPIMMNADEEFFSGYKSMFKSSRFGRVAVNTRRTIAFRDSDLIPESLLTESDIYKSFMHPHDLFYGGGIIVTDKGSLMAELALFRTDEQGDFSDKEIYILDILKKHIEIRLIRENKLKEPSFLAEDKTLKLIGLGLTSREIDIVKLIIKNLDTVEISNELHISINTTKKHINHIFAKLAVKNRLQLIQTYSRI